MSQSPSFHERVSSATLIKVFSGTLSPKWQRIRQFVGPQWLNTCVFGWSTLNLIWPRLHVAAALNFSRTLHVIGASLQFLVLAPRANSSNCFQSPVSLRFSASLAKSPSSDSNFRPSSRIICQYFWISCRLSLYVVWTFVQNGVDFKRSTLYSDLWYSDRKSPIAAPFL